MRLLVFLLCLLILACKPTISTNTTAGSLSLPEEPQLTKEKILESTLESLAESREYRVPLNKEFIQNLDDYSVEEVALLKNSIYAQHGRKFSTDWLQKYFKSRSWYKPGAYKEELLTEIDKKNVKLLAEIQERLVAARKQSVQKYDPVGFIEIGGAFAETFFHLYCPNQTYTTLDYHDLRMERGWWVKKAETLQVQLVEICSYSCLKKEPLGCEKSKLKKCYKPPAKDSIIPGVPVGEEQFEEFVEEGSHSGDHDLAWHFNMKKHPLGKEPKLCNLDFKPKTFEQAADNFYQEQ